MRIILLIGIFYCGVLQAQPLLLNLNNGSTGQVLMKTSNAVADYTWQTLTKTTVGLSNVDNTSDANKPVSSATTTALNGKQATLVSGTNIKTVNGNSLLGSGDVVISGTAAWGSVTGTLASQTDLITALNLKATLASPTFTGTVSGITASMVGLGNVTNESKSTMFTSPTFTGTVSGVTASMVGLGNVTNESKATMFASPTFTGTVTLPASTSLTTPVLGVATGTSLAATGNITSSTGGIGYVTGNGGTVTQATSKATGVTLNKLAGDITMNAAALAAAAIVSFTITNSTIGANDIIHLQHQATGTFGAYTINGRTAAGSAVISVRNNTAGSLSEAIVIRYIIIKSTIN